MMPIRKGDGTGLSVPGFSEVRTGDGTVLWSAGADIPDSVVARYPHQSGSGSTLVDTIGSNDGTINAATWVSDADAIEGQKLAYNGADDWSLIPNSSAINFAGAFTVIKTFEFDDFGSTQGLISKGEFGAPEGAYDYSLGLLSDGRLDFRISDGSSNDRLLYDISAAISAGTKHRVGILWDGTTDAGGMAISLDGSVVADTAATITSLQQSTNDVAVSRGGPNDNRRYADLSGSDDLIFANDRYSTQQLSDDYNGQPWS